jgi:myo-inositol-1(or 4)-monophosphatase
MTLIALDSFVEQLADASGQVILPFFRARLDVMDKGAHGHFDPVTEADRAAELIIRQRIQAMFPTHGIRGEEHGTHAGDGIHEWIIDPIDGTRAFVCGLPTWGTLIGFAKNGRAVLGAMNQPYVGERFMGDGARAWMTHAGTTRKLVTRPCAHLADAALATTSPRLFTGKDADAFARIESGVRHCRFGTDCYAYALLAAGQIDLVVEAGLQSYDIAALIPIIEGAGGVVTTWDGGNALEGGRIVAAGDARLHAAALERLQG